MSQELVRVEKALPPGLRGKDLPVLVAMAGREDSQSTSEGYG